MYGGVEHARVLSIKFSFARESFLPLKFTATYTVTIAVVSMESECRSYYSATECAWSVRSGLFIERETPDNGERRNGCQNRREAEQ